MPRVTNDERREAAERLRGLHLGGGSKDLIERTLSDAIGAWRKSGMSWDFITDRLADLIEPDIYPDIPDKPGRIYPPCDRDALLALADECDEMRDNGCLNGSYELYRIARRIREALGADR